MLNLVANGSSGYNLTNSLRFRSSASAYLSRTFSASGTTATFSVWVKRGALGSYQTIFGWSNLSNTSFGIDLNLDTLAFYSYSSAFVLNLVTTQVLRDPSAWYHIVCVIDTTQATAANRAKIYINGSQVTALSTATYPSQNTLLNLATNTSWSIGRVASATTHYDGYMAEWNFIDGQALTPSSFGSTNATTGVWQPAKYTGTYGTNGFYLNFSSIALTSGSNTGLGKDNSGNGNYWNTNNISVTAGTTYDAMTDVPTLTSATAGNYCTPTPLDMFSTSVMSNGNLTVNVSGSSSGAGAGGTARVNTINFTGLSGKWYWEAFVDNAGTGVATLRTTFGMIAEPARCSNNPTGAAWSWRADGVGAPTGAGTFATNDVVMFAYDSATGKLWLGKNGTWTNSGVPDAGTGNNATLTALAEYALFLNYGTSGGGTGTASFNFGQRPFSYSAPTGFLAVNTYNLPTPTILQGNKYMDATLYTGNGSTQTITNASAFKPDFVWVKTRVAAADHGLYDSVRGVSKFLGSNGTFIEQNLSPYGVTAFNSNGFTVADISSGANGANGASGGLYSGTPPNYVGWQWQAGQGSTSSNTNGSITSTVSVNTTAGFSVVTYTGTGANATVGHGLGVAPSFTAVKCRNDGTIGWVNYHASLGNTKFLNLNSTNAAGTGSTVWNNTSPTSTTIALGTDSAVNGSTKTYVAYCWAAIAGFSKAFSYTGNGSADGSFVYTGFLPRFVLIKRTDTTGDWYMWDTARNTYDVITNTLLANSSAAETSATSIDALSNGFKLRNTTAGFNASGGTYIGMAWASSPFKNSNAF